jgi:hypothetical protein
LPAHCTSAPRTARVTMTGSETQGGGQGGTQGPREFSLTPSLAFLPGLSCEDTGQGGKYRGASNPAKTPENGDSRASLTGPSLAVCAQESTSARSTEGTRQGEKGTRLESEKEPVLGVVTGVQGERLVVRLPAEAPSLTKPACRALLVILVELTEVPVLDGPSDRGTT